MADTQQKFLDNLNGVPTLWAQIKSYFVQKTTGKDLSTNDFTNDYKNKLDGIAKNAEVNQNTFSNVVVGTTTIAADAKTDTIKIVQGDNVTLTPDATNDALTIAAKDTTYSKVSEFANDAGYQTSSQVQSAINSALTSAVTYKGSVTNESNLPTANQKTGDMYNIESASSYGDAGMNVIWNGSSWDAAGSNLTITAMTADDVKAICTVR